MTPDEWRASGDYFEWRGHRIFFRIEGAGEPLLLIHGFPTASWDFTPVWAALVARYRVFTLDMIGFGFSAKPKRFDYQLMAQADLYEALLAREGVTSCRVLAHDYGVTVAQELLARKRVQSLVLLNGGLFPETHRATVMQKLLASPLGPLVVKLSSYKTFAAQMRAVWGRTKPSSEELRGMWQLVTTNDGMAVMPKIIDYIAQRKRHRARWVGAVVNATIPIRLVNGPVDPVSGAHMLARYRELVPNPNIVELPGVGHYPQVEAPQAVLDAVFAHFA